MTTTTTRERKHDNFYFSSEEDVLTHNTATAFYQWCRSRITINDLLQLISGQHSW